MSIFASMGKKLKFAALLLPLLIQTCTTELELAADWKEITIVYGLLNYADTAHYVKINKAFLDKERSAFAVAKIGDSLFHNKTLDVKIEEYLNESLQNTYTLTKIDGNDDGLIKDPNGIFASSPNYL